MLPTLQRGNAFLEMAEQLRKGFEFFLKKYLTPKKQRNKKKRSEHMKIYTVSK